MGSQTPINNDRSRTYWTPTMERYFVDLMLEHMQRGDRVGHTFNKQAWTDMLNVFNAKFGSQYDKDALKTRYTNLWKQFNDIKYLLGQNGFSWDETRQMVTAADYVWDAYIKVHPDARSYKTKPVLNFNDLCLIFGYTNADGRYSLSSHDIDIDDEIQGVDAGAGMVGPVSSSNERPKTDWKVEMDQYLIELLLDQLGRGNKIDSTFSKQAWAEILSLFNAKFGPQHGKRALRHRYKKLWKYYNDMTSLLKQKGFSWDETQQLIAAEDHVWNAYVKAHPHARSYRKKPLPNYKDLVLIYGNAAGVERQSLLDESEDIKGDILSINTGEGKESRTPTSSDRSRTYWTPPMDRYLVNLLLEQVYSGNKLGQTFITQAWVHMVTSFNVNFNSHHDKEVLKNRYKHLRRLYNEIKTLLEQDGFSWDDTRGMVVAADHVWDAYTKVHPDARSYRVKTVPSYHKLCIIYGKESSDQSYSRLARCADPDGEIPHLACGEEDGDQFLAEIDTSVDWIPTMDRCLIDLMLGQIREGHKINQTLSEEAWTHIIASFKKNFGLLYDRYVIEKQYMRLIKEYNDITSILNESGFLWDATQQVLIADDTVWEAYIKEHPDSIVYRDRILENYNDLSLIFGPGISDGFLSCKVLEMDTDDIEALDAEMNVISEQGRKRQSATPPAFSKKVPKTSRGRVEDAFTEMACVVTSLAPNKKGERNYASIENAIDALQAIPGLDDELLLDACDLLEDDKKAKTFLALDATLRKKWLLRKLRP